MPHSIETRLSTALEPTAAPAGLWARVDAALPDATSRSRARAVWPSNLLMAAALAVLLSGGVLYLRAQQPSRSTFTTAAISFHLGGLSTDPAQMRDYAIQRYTVEGEPVTVVSKPLPGDLAGATHKQLHTTQAGLLAVSEWSYQGRSWALISRAAHHQQACQVCHRA